MIGLLSQHPLSATVSVVPTPAVSYSVFRPNTRRHLQCISSQHPPSSTVSCQHPPSATVYFVPRPTISYCVCHQLQCVSFQHPPSATVSVFPTPAVSYSVCHANTRRQLQCLSCQHPPSAETATGSCIDLATHNFGEFPF